MSPSDSLPRRSAATAMLFGMIGFATASRTLLEAAPSNPLCDVWTAGADIAGGDVPGSGTITDSLDACLALCKSTDGCNAAVRHGSGPCYIKGAPLDVVANTVGGYSSYLICDGSTSSPLDPPLDDGPPMDDPPLDDEPPASGNPLCDVWTAAADIAGGDVPGSGTFTANEDECLALCKSTDGCNAAVRHGSGPCYIKGASLDVVANTVGGYSSYLICDGSTPSPPDPPVEDDPPADDDPPMDDEPPATGNPLCDVWTAGVDIAGGDVPGSGVIQGSLDECLAYCLSKTGCNAAVWTPGGGQCYIKGVPLDIVATPNGGLTSYLVCDGTAVPPPPPPPPMPTTDGPLDQYFKFDTCNADTVPLPAACSGGQPFYPISNGDTFCWEPKQEGGYKPTKVLVGGEVTFKKDGACVPFPTKTDGHPCCKIYYWQPSERDGKYRNECTMQVQPNADGVFYFRSEIPGDEEMAGIGPDPEPHFHFEVACGDCAADSAVGDKGERGLFCNKFYIEEAWLDGDTTEENHLAEESKYKGEETHKYNIVVNLDKVDEDKL